MIQMVLVSVEFEERVDPAVREGGRREEVTVREVFLLLELAALLGGGALG